MSLQLFRPGPLFPPWARWTLVALAALVGVAVVAAAWNGLWDWLPWSAESRLEAAEEARDTARSDAAARGAESAAAAEQLHRVEAATRIIVETQAATAQVAAAARSAPDANDPLDPDRAARLRGHDRELCRLSPGLRGCPADAGDPGPGG